MPENPDRSRTSLVNVTPILYANSQDLRRFLRRFPDDFYENSPFAPIFPTYILYASALQERKRKKVQPEIPYPTRTSLVKHEPIFLQNNKGLRRFLSSK